MAKEDLLLRVTSNPPLTTKGSPLEWTELDDNWIEIYNAFVALSQSSYVPAYDAAVEYDDTVNNYVTYSSQIWKFINSTPAINVTPTEGATWTKVYATDLVNRPNRVGVEEFEALISQQAPIASQTSGTFPIGMIVSITTYVAGDDFSNWTLVSGTVNTTGAVYQVTAPAPTAWSNGSTLAYDGRPYIVSTDENGDLNPFINTILDTITFSYSSSLKYFVTCTGRFLLDKTTFSIQNNNTDTANTLVMYSEEDDDRITIKASTTGMLNYTPIRIAIKK